MARTRSWCFGSMISTWLPQRCQKDLRSARRFRIGSRQRRQDAPAAVEELGGIRLRGPTARCRRSGVPVMKCTPSGTCGPNVANDSHLHRTDVAQDRAVFEGRRQFLRELRRTCRPAWPASRDRLRARRMPAYRAAHRQNQARALSLDRLSGPPGVSGNVRGKTGTPHRVSERGADQADADQRHLGKQRAGESSVTSLS